MIRKRIKELERVKSRVLLHLIKGSSSLPLEGFSDIRGQSAVLALERFLYEVLLCIKEEGMVEIFLPQGTDARMLPVEGKPGLNRPAKMRVLTVISKSQPCSPANKLSEYKETRRVPSIHLTGKWLKSYGFEIGKKIVVYPGKSGLILRLSESCIKYKDMLRGGGGHG